MPSPIRPPDSTGIAPPAPNDATPYPRLPEPDLSATTSLPPTPPVVPFDEQATVQARASAATQPDFEIRLFGPYELLEEVAHGGMGVVYKARDTRLGRVVALKMIRSGALAQVEEVERFHRETQAASQLDHPHVIKIYEVGQHDGRHYFTMPFAVGGTLTRRLDRFTADPRAAVALVEKIARAVHCAHGQDILHRDLKPANILLDEHGEPWVSDFGLAKFLDGNLELTQSGQTLGTPAYMAPEQTEGKQGRLTPQTDVWSLGVLLYELLAGRRPFDGRSREEITRRLRTDEPAWPRSLHGKAGRALEAVVRKCLQKDPARRYASAAALADDLARWLRGEPLSVRPERWPARLARTLHRHYRITTAVILFGILAVTTPVAYHLSDPDRPLRAIESELAQERAVTLIGETGGPRWHKVRTENGTFKIRAPANKPFSVEATSSCLVELLCDPKQERYRFRAEIRHDDAWSASEVGLYFAYSQYATDQGPFHCYLKLAFADRGDRDLWHVDDQGNRSSEVALTPNLYREAGQAGSLTRHVSPFLSQPFTANPNERVWRMLEVEVTPEAIQVFWEGKRIGKPQSRPALAEFTKLMLTDLPGVTPDFAPRGALGLYVCNGTASFRQVVVAPLP